MIKILGYVLELFLMKCAWKGLLLKNISQITKKKKNIILYSEIYTKKLGEDLHSDQ